LKQNQTVLTEAFFSIIIPTYNRADLLRRAMESVLAQSMADWELIIVDDGSTDNTKSMVESFDDSRIHYFYHEHQERSKARNLGIERSSGSFISFLDDDDYYQVDFCKEFKKAIEKNDKHTAIYLADEYRQLDGAGKVLFSVAPSINENVLRTLWKMQISLRSMVIDRTLLEKENFDRECNWGQDFELAIRLVLKNPVVYVPKALSVYVLHDDQGTKRKFRENLEENAINSISCIGKLIENHKQDLLKFIPQNELYDILNHKCYGFAARAMKQGNTVLWARLLRMIDRRGSLRKNIYFYLSLLIRFPYYSLFNRH